MCCVLFFVLCIVCCVSQYCVLPTIKCNFFQQNLIFFHKNKFILCELLMLFLSDVGFSMSASSVRLMWPNLWWSRCVFGAVLEPLRRHSAGRIEPSFRRPLAPMGMSCNKPYKFYLPTDFHNFCCKKFSNQQAINTLKKINKMFNKTIWILTFF